MRIEAVYGVLIPLLGTTLGAACVFFMRKNMKDGIQRSLTGFASGVMVAASVWSLLIPSIEQSESMGRFCVRAGTCRFYGLVCLFLAAALII